jgi:hypothetical protein
MTGFVGVASGGARNPGGRSAVGRRLATVETVAGIPQASRRVPAGLDCGRNKGSTTVGR